MLHISGKRKSIMLCITGFLLIAIFVGMCECSFQSQDAENLCNAIHDGDLVLLEQLLKDGADCNAYTYSLLLLPAAIIIDGKLPTTPLMTACALGDADAASLLLEYGADPNRFYLGNYSCTGAVYSTPTGREARYELIPLLLSYGADMRKTGHRTIATPDEHAAFLELEYMKDAEKSIELLKLMTDTPSELRNWDGTTLLEAADNADIERWLIEQGAVK